MENTNKWSVTVKKGFEPIIVLSKINNVSDLLNEFQETNGFRPVNIVRL